MQLAGPGACGPPRDPGAERAVLRRAIVLGVDHIDTSQYYGPDVVNELIREALHPLGELDLIAISNVDRRRRGERSSSSTGRDPERLQHHRPPGRRDGRVGRERGSRTCRSSRSARRSGRAGTPGQTRRDRPGRGQARGHAAQIALAWLLARYERMLLIPGTSLIVHLDENMAAIGLALDDADLAVPRSSPVTKAPASPAASRALRSMTCASSVSRSFPSARSSLPTSAATPTSSSTASFGRCRSR